jgi:hypothetical protein
MHIHRYWWVGSVTFIADTFHDWRISHDVGSVNSLLLFVPPWLPFGLGENFFCFIVSRVSMRPELRIDQFMIFALVYSLVLKKNVRSSLRSLLTTDDGEKLQ